MKKLKLNAFHKEMLQKKEMNSLTGGVYCYDEQKGGGGTVQKANDVAGKCSCLCNFGMDYYGSSGINSQASELRKWDNY